MSLPAYCEDSHLATFYSGLVALHKNGQANTEIRMYGDERLPFEVRFDYSVVQMCVFYQGFYIKLPCLFELDPASHLPAQIPAS